MPNASRSVKVLITGASGQVGRALAATAPEPYRLVLTDRATLDIGDRQRVDNFLRSERPSIVINAAAYTAVDKAEAEPEKAREINAAAPQFLAESVKAIEAFLVQISTDFVFDGKSSHPYRPADPTAPLSVYGLTKRDGETAVTRALPGASCLIIRTAWVYGIHGNNFVKTMLRLMRERKPLRVIGDQVGTPTWASSLAVAIWQALARNLSGLHHWTDAGTASWYDFAVAIYEEALALGLVPDGPMIRQITTDDYPTPATRPAYSVLDKSATWAALGEQPPHWRQQLRAMLRELKRNDDAA